MKTITIATACFLLALSALAANAAALDNPLAPGNYLWYAPEHERYGRTTFYSQPAFDTAMVRVTRTQRFKVVAARRGWVQIQFDVAGKAFVHLRVLNNMLYDPNAADGMYEFQRAALFTEEPAKIEARLKSPTIATTPTTVDSKTPSWKNYKDSWGLKPTRPTAGAPEDTGSETTRSTTPRTQAGIPGIKPRPKHPLLPPIGAEPPQEGKQSENAEPDAETATTR